MSEISIARIVYDIWYTPIYRYRHPGTGRRVTIIGTARLGTPGYYRILAEQIRRCTVDGGLVYGEAGPYGLNDATGSTAGEQAVLDIITHLDTLEHHLAARLGWARQSDTLTAAAGWRTLDVSQIEVIRASGVDRFHDALRQRQAILGDPAQPDSCARMRQIIGGQARTLTLRGQRRGPLDDILIAARSRLVQDAAATTISDVVLVYEAKHLPALDPVIRTLGLARAHGEWIPALAIPRQPHPGPGTSRPTPPRQPRPNPARAAVTS